MRFWNSPTVVLRLAILAGLVIVAMSSIPARQMPKAPELWRWDKLVHALEYALFATLVFRALVLRGHRLAVAVLAGAVLCSLCGVLDEAYQSTVPGRDSSAFDALADSVGACFACIASAVLYSRTPHVDHPNLQ